MNRVHLQQILQELRDSFHCPQCGQRYSLSHIQFRGHLGNLYFVQLSCPGHMPMMALAKIVEQDSSWIIEKSLQITDDDVLQFATDIEQFRGHFASAWPQTDKL